MEKGVLMMKKTKCLPVFAVLMLVISVSACSQSWYVSAGGSDANAGISEGKAFKTLTRAVQAAQTGDIKRITVVGALTERTENTSDEEAIFMIEDSGDREILITGTKNATLQGRGRVSDISDVHAVLGIFGNSKIRLENITVTRGSIGIGVANGAVLTIGKNTLVSENHNTDEDEYEYDDGGGVMIVDGTLIMNDGAITNNTGRGGGGVYLKEGAAFTMTGGTISNNTARELGGGGVMVGDMSGNDTSTFTMTGGTISNNTAKIVGGGVWLTSSSTSIMSGGTISGNSAQGGGGISTSNSTLTISGKAAITGNSAPGGVGGGVVVAGTTTVTMTGGTISNNTAKIAGGGVSVVGSVDWNDNVEGTGTFTMSGGVIEKNTAPENPNVHIFTDRGGQFEQTGGRLE
jgi:hypothetical protein